MNNIKSKINARSLAAGVLGAVVATTVIVDTQWKPESTDKAFALEEGIENTRIYPLPHTRKLLGLLATMNPIETLDPIAAIEEKTPELVHPFGGGALLGDLPINVDNPLVIEKALSTDTPKALVTKFDWDDTVDQYVNPQKNTFGQLPYSYEQAQSIVFDSVQTTINKLPASQTMPTNAREHLSYELAARLHQEILPRDLITVVQVLRQEGNIEIADYVASRNARVQALGTKGNDIEEFEFIQNTADRIHRSIKTQLEQSVNHASTTLTNL